VRSALLAFALRFGAAFALLAAGWLALAPHYDWLVFQGANAAFGLDDPRIVEIGKEAGTFYAFELNGDARRPVFQFDTFGVFFNLVLLSALLLAAPRLGWLARLGRLALGWLALGGVHLAFVVVQVKAEFVNAGLTFMEPGTAYTYNWLAALLGTVGEQFSPLLIAALLTGGAWARALGLDWGRTRPGNPPQSRNAPCPCGSGKKLKHCCGRHATPASRLRPSRP